MDMASMDMTSVSSSMSMDMASMSSTISSMASMASATASMSMDMASMSSAMASMSMDMASAAATATSTAAMDMGSDSSMDMGGSCKISMLWNWNTIDACFISTDWHIKSRGMFAGTCIGVFAWILALEALRRAHREFDRYVAQTSSVETIDETCCDSKTGTISLITRHLPPSLWQQAVRSLLYTIEFGASYLLMLMAMYYNGYILITMWVSVFLSYFLLSGDTIGIQQVKQCC